MEDKQNNSNYPNRFAKQIRNSAQLSNLLDGEGVGAVEMEEQQMKAMEHEQAEQAVASQTERPELTRHTNVGGGGYQPTAGGGPQVRTVTGGGPQAGAGGGYSNGGTSRSSVGSYQGAQQQQPQNRLLLPDAGSDPGAFYRS